ncbi:hypothetical protein [Herbaspirillum camelliae]|uniref:hypothetical protein n=1 Tax=Herbaspirillum camelliae TaxID=1892903 RepID=UPI000949EF90|nr:hypothetical protein [Herbaspirillum camelliae]
MSQDQSHDQRQHAHDIDRDQPLRPKEGPTETHYEKEAQGHEGTLGGQPPLNAPAGIQRVGRGGVLVEKSPASAPSDPSSDKSGVE